MSRCTGVKALWGKFWKWWSDKGEVYFAWTLLWGSIILWPVSQLTFAKNEYPVTLGLSWLAIMLTALDYLKNSRAHRDIKGDGS